MADFLASVGRARPSQAVKDVIQTGINARTAEARNALIRSRTALNTQELNQMRQQALFEREQHEKMSRPFSAKRIADTFYGGTNGSMWKFVEKLGKRRGLFGNVGGELTLTGYTAQQGMELLSDPKNATMMLRAGLNDANRNIAAIEAEMEGKTGSALEKLQQQKQQHENFKDQFIAGLEQVTKGKFETEEEQEFERDITERETASKELSSEARMKSAEASMLRAKRTEEETEGQVTQREKLNIRELQRIEDDIMQISQKLASVRSGQDIQSAALGSEKGTVIKNLENKLDTLLKSYQDKGGDPARLGFAEGEVIQTGTIIVNDETGEELIWDGAQWQPYQKGIE